MTAQNQLRQILSDNKTCKNSGCACCAHWNTTVYRLLTLLGTVLDTFQIAVAARNRLLQEIANLKRQLLLYDNPNTPSSQKRISHKKQRMAQNGSDNVTKRLAGAQPGHNKTAERLPIDGEKHHRCSNCPGCHGEDLTEYGTEEFVITDIPRIVKAVTIRHYVHMYRCNRCGREGIKPKTARRAEDAGRMTGRQPDTAEQAPRERAAVQQDAGRMTGRQPDTAEQAPRERAAVRRDAVQGRRSVVHIPRSGTYGLNVLAAILFNFMDRLPNRLNVASMGRIGLRISTGTVHNILYRIGTNLDPPSRQILKRIREAYVLHVDETSISLNGKLAWIWIFLNPETDDAYYVIRRSRGGDVLREALGKSWRGRLVCDGLAPYRKYTIQRCWAHILNEIKHIAGRNPNCREAQTVRDMLKEIHRLGLEAAGSIQERRRVRNLLRKRVKRLIDTYGENPVLNHFLTVKLRNAERDLFLYVVDPRVTSTNNAAERGLREPVVHRKVRGSIRSEETMKWWGNLFTCIMTWRARNVDIHEELAKYV